MPSSGAAPVLTEGVAEAYPSRADGKVLLPFKRLFVVAYR